MRVSKQDLGMDALHAGWRHDASHLGVFQSLLDWAKCVML